MELTSLVEAKEVVSAHLDADITLSLLASHGVHCTIGGQGKGLGTDCPDTTSLSAGHRYKECYVKEKLCKVLETIINSVLFSGYTRTKKKSTVGETKSQTW